MSEKLGSIGTCFWVPTVRDYSDSNFFNPDMASNTCGIGIWRNDRFVWDFLPDNIDAPDVVVPGRAAWVWTLRWPMGTDEVIQSCGGATALEVDLSLVWRVIVAVQRGMALPELADGKMNVSFVRNLEGEARIIFYRWNNRVREWDVGALERDNYDIVPWEAGTRVISENAPRLTFSVSDKSVTA